MAYCVHCGVKLAEYEKNCPLCGTVVLDPGAAGGESRPMFVEIDRAPDRRINRRFIVLLLSVVLLIPFAVVAAIDLFVSSQMTWALYVFGAELCFWVYFVFPLNYQQNKPYFQCAANIVVTALFLLIVNLSTGGDWYLPLALPLALITGLSGMLVLFICRRKNTGRVEKTGWSCVALAILASGIDISISHYVRGDFWPIWSWYVAIPLIVLGAVLLVISRSVKMSEWIRRRLFI